MTFHKYMLTGLIRRPLHPFLLPFYFVLSVYNHFAGLFQPLEVAGAWATVLAGILVVFTLLYVIYLDIVNAGILTTLAGFLYLFFGNIKETLAGIPGLSFFSHYKTLLPLLTFIAGFVLYYLYRHRSLVRLNFFFNILLLLYTGIEIWKIARISNRADVVEITFNDSNIQPGNRPLPDIYFIVTDGYPSSSFQKEVLGVTHNFLDSFLVQKGFYVVPEPRSNYRATAFSMASTLGMNYHHWVKEAGTALPYHYNQALAAIYEAPVFEKLEDWGYKLHNLSIFDLPGQPSV